DRGPQGHAPGSAVQEHRPRPRRGRRAGRLHLRDVRQRPGRTAGAGRRDEVSGKLETGNWESETGNGRGGSMARASPPRSILLLPCSAFHTSAPAGFDVRFRSVQNTPTLLVQRIDRKSTRLNSSHV